MNDSADTTLPVAATAPSRAALEAWMVDKVAETLNVSRSEIHVCAPFASLGLESLDAFSLAGDLAAWLNRELSATLLWEHSNIQALAAFLCDGTRESTPDNAQTAWKSLTPLQPHGARTPFFCVHGIGGSVLCYQHLARHLGPEQPFYAFQAPLQVQDDHASRQSIEELATAYIREMREFQPRGPYLLGGVSFGGIVAFEMARQLEDKCEVGLVALFDSLCPGFARPMSLRRQLFLHGERMMRLKLREKLTYARSKLGGKMGAIRATGARQLWKVTDHAARKIGRELPPAFRRTHMAHNLAIRDYTALAYGGHVTLFRAVDRLGADDDPHNGWNRVAQGGVAAHDVPGDHFTLLDEPNVGSLAACLNTCLQQAQEKAS